MRAIEARNELRCDPHAAPEFDGGASVYHTTKALEVETVDGAAVGPSAQACSCCRPRPNRVWLALAVCVGVAAAYAAFERIGTHANASTIEFMTNFGGGFLAIGMSDDQPGFIVLSALEQEQVRVSAEQVSGVAAGTYTLVEVQTLHQRWESRLRDPQAIVIREDGTVVANRVEWGIEDFERIRTDTDCSHERTSGKHRCGAPFADLFDLVSADRLADVPDDVRVFLKRFVEQ